MPHPKEIALVVLLAAVEALAGFMVIAAAGLDRLTPAGAGIFWLILVCEVAGTGVELGVATARLRGPAERAVLAGPGIVLAVGIALVGTRSLSSTIVLAVLLGLFYWRGTTISQEAPDYEEVRRRFAFGLGLVLLGIVLAVARAVGSTTWPILTLAGIAYILAGLAALAMARLEAHRERGTAPSVSLAVGIQLGILLLISLVAISLFSLNIGLYLDSLLGSVWNVIANGIALIAAILAYPIIWLLGHVHVRLPHMRRPRPPRTKGLQHGLTAHHGHHAAAHGGLTAVILIVTALVVISLVLLLVAAIPRREQEEREEGFEEERGRLLTPGAAWRLFLAWLAGLFRRGIETAGQGVTRARRRVLGPTYPADPVRRIYAQLLHRAATYGVSRRGSVTPQEFLHHLQTRWPEGQAEFAAITETYVVRRYAEREPDAEELRRLREVWRRARGVIRRSEATDGRDPDLPAA
ncbi:MAG TPA: DUF4129 domain-containing protein [Chloroflexota bacterium]|nr:DUF4129 domain-containing protein [Chloroflexota bacterium]